MEQHQLQFLPKDTVEIDYEALPDDASLVAHLSAGAFAGIMEHTVMYPIDSLKTRMQVATSTQEFSKSVISTINKISSSEGAYSLWRGVSSVVVGAGPAHAVYFSVFEAAKTLLVNRIIHNGNPNHSNTNSNGSSKLVTDENHPLIASLAGIAATTASDALMTPFDVLKQRMQATASSSNQLQKGKNNTVKLLQTASSLYRHEGVSAFYISYPTTLFTNIPFAALNFGFYEYCSLMLNPDNNYNPYLHCVSGGIAGGIAAALTTPLDCIKTALQTRGISQNENLRNVTGFKTAARAIHKEFGIRGFLKGLKPRIIFNVPSTAISWTAYEMAKEILLR
ncbi:RNA splicing protein and member of the mitochondrial carrier family [Scheffersomyces amazonensis]|uniref:RNA splicing protein and member of the mitochondrial carrier family n=1 Tax=Scheffersomyces amazonensis TaxID=1078765 RepID=UPI00315D76BE